MGEAFLAAGWREAPLSPSRRLRGRGDELSGSCASSITLPSLGRLPGATSSMSARSLVTSRTLSASFAARPSAAAATSTFSVMRVVGHLAGHHQARALHLGGGAPPRPPGWGARTCRAPWAVWSARPSQPFDAGVAAPARAGARQHGGDHRCRSAPWGSRVQHGDHHLADLAVGHRVPVPGRTISRITPSSSTRPSRALGLVGDQADVGGGVALVAPARRARPASRARRAERLRR